MGREGDAERNSLKTIIPSLVFQLCLNIPSLRPALIKARPSHLRGASHLLPELLPHLLQVLKQQANIHSLTVRHMFEGLLLYPLNHLHPGNSSQHPVVVVLDNVALEDDQNQLLVVLPQWISILPQWLRFVVTAKPGSQVLPPAALRMSLAVLHPALSPFPPSAPSPPLSPLPPLPPSLSAFFCIPPPF